MVGIHQFDQYLVRAGRHPGQVDRIEITRGRLQPRQIVHMYVEMSDPWRYVEGALSEHRYDAHVLHPPLDPDDALIRHVGKRGLHNQLTWRLVLDFDVRRGAADLLPYSEGGGLCTGACRCLGPGGDNAAHHCTCNQQ